MTEQTPEPKASRQPRWIRWLRDIALLLVVFLVIQWWQSQDLAAGPAPALLGHLVDGTPYQHDVSTGPILVHFWATWCPICRLEQGSIDDISRDAPVITVATTSGSAGELADYVREQGLVMPVLVDEGGEIARAWGVTGVPATFIVDSSGDITYSGMGYATELGLRLRLWLSN